MFAAWLRDANGNYTAGNHILSLYAFDASGWVIRGTLVNGDTIQLSGAFADEAEAQEAIRRLVEGIDAGTYAP